MFSDASSLRSDNVQYNNQRPNISKSPSGSSVTYSRKKEQETNFKSKYREPMDTESQTEEIAKPDENISNNTVNGNGKSTATRKLSVIIPQVIFCSDATYDFLNPVSIYILFIISLHWIPIQHHLS